MAFKDEILKKPGGQQLYDKIVSMAKNFKLQPGKSDATDVWRAVLAFAKAQSYVPGGPTPSTLIVNNMWNCESLSFLIIYLAGYVKNEYLNPVQCTGGWIEANGRRLSITGLTPNMHSIQPPNVSMDGKKVRYSFASHMWAKIDQMDLDAVTGLSGPQVAAAWPVIVPKNNEIDSLGLSTYDLVETGTRGNGMKEFNLEEKL